MKIAIIGAAGKTGSQLVHAALQLGWQVSGVFREASAGRLDGFASQEKTGQIYLIPHVRKAGIDQMKIKSLAARATRHRYKLEGAFRDSL